MDQLPAEPAGRIEARLGQAEEQLVALAGMTDRLGQGIDPVQRQAQGLADVAHGGTRPIGDQLGRHAGPFAAVFLVDILNHFFPALMLEVDVDVGGFVAILGNEPLEQDVDPIGVDGRDSQAIADGRVGRRAASLAEDAHGAGKADQVPDGQEIGRVVQLLDDRQLALDELAHLGRDAGGITLSRPGPGKPREVGDRRLAGGA